MHKTFFFSFLTTLIFVVALLAVTTTTFFLVSAHATSSSSSPTSPTTSFSILEMDVKIQFSSSSLTQNQQQQHRYYYHHLGHNSLDITLGTNDTNSRKYFSVGVAEVGMSGMIVGCRNPNDYESTTTATATTTCVVMKGQGYDAKTDFSKSVQVLNVDRTQKRSSVTFRILISDLMPHLSSSSFSSFSQDRMVTRMIFAAGDWKKTSTKNHPGHHEGHWSQARLNIVTGEIFALLAPGEENYGNTPKLFIAIATGWISILVLTLVLKFLHEYSSSSSFTSTSSSLQKRKKKEEEDSTFFSFSSFTGKISFSNSHDFFLYHTLTLLTVCVVFWTLLNVIQTAYQEFQSRGNFSASGRSFGVGAAYMFSILLLPTCKYFNLGIFVGAKYEKFLTWHTVSGIFTFFTIIVHCLMMSQAASKGNFSNIVFSWAESYHARPVLPALVGLLIFIIFIVFAVFRSKESFVNKFLKLRKVLQLVRQQQQQQNNSNNNNSSNDNKSSSGSNQKEEEKEEGSFCSYYWFRLTHLTLSPIFLFCFILHYPPLFMIILPSLILYLIDLKFRANDAEKVKLKNFVVDEHSRVAKLTLSVSSGKNEGDQETLIKKESLKYGGRYCLFSIPELNNIALEKRKKLKKNSSSNEQEDNKNVVFQTIKNVVGSFYCEKNHKVALGEFPHPFSVMKQDCNNNNNNNNSSNESENCYEITFLIRGIGNFTNSLVDKCILLQQEQQENSDNSNDNNDNSNNKKLTFHLFSPPMSGIDIGDFFKLKKSNKNVDLNNNNNQNSLLNNLEPTTIKEMILVAGGVGISAAFGVLYSLSNLLFSTNGKKCEQQQEIKNNNNNNNNQGSTNTYSSSIEMKEEEEKSDNNDNNKNNSSSSEQQQKQNENKIQMKIRLIWIVREISLVKMLKSDLLELVEKFDSKQQQQNQQQNKFSLSVSIYVNSSSKNKKNTNSNENASAAAAVDVASNNSENENEKETEEETDEIIFPSSSSCENNNIELFHTTARPEKSIFQPKFSKKVGNEVNYYVSGPSSLAETVREVAKENCCLHVHEEVFSF